MHVKARYSTNCRVSSTPLRRSSQVRREGRRLALINAQLLPEAHVDATALTYVGLGSAAAAFLGTFFVIPQFKDSFKEGMNWKDIHRELSKSGVKVVTPTEALEMSKKGAVLLDVRMAGRYQASAKAPGSINIPLYQPIQNWDFASNLRRAGFAFFGVYGTELNDDFVQEVMDEIPISKQVIAMCDNGGTINTKVGAQSGFQSRSLKAVFFLQQAGYKNVYHLEGGLGQWFREDLPAEDEGEEETATAFNLSELVSSKGRK